MYPLKHVTVAERKDVAHKSCKINLKKLIKKVGKQKTRENERTARGADDWKHFVRSG